jgi:hypothetical protein
MEIYGVQGQLGDLLLKPALREEQFDGNGQASVTTLFADRKLNIVYRNGGQDESGGCRVRSIEIDGRKTGFESRDGGALLPRGVIASLDQDRVHTVLVEL